MKKNNRFQKTLSTCIATLLTVRFWFTAIVLILTIFLSKWEWFQFGHILQFGDWGYRHDEYLKQLFQEWGAWNSAFQFGSSNITLFAYPVRGIIWSGLVNLGLSSQDAIRVAVFIPIAILGFVSPFTFVWYKTRDVVISTTLALFYLSIPYFLVTTTAHLPISMVFILTPLMLLVLEHASLTQKFRWWICLILLLAFCAAHDIRIAILSSFLLCGYFLCLLSEGANKRTRIIQSLSAGILLIFLQSYWLLVTIFQGTDDIAAVANRGLFGTHLFDLIHAFTITKWNWTGGSVDWTFTLMLLPIQLFLIPLLVFSAFLFRFKDQGREKIVLYFGLVALIGVFLTKQGADPFPTTYKWLYEYVPPFSLFREASKLYILTAIGYLGVLTYLLHELRLKYKALFLMSTLVIVGVSVINLKPSISKDIGGLYVERRIPSDYQILKKRIACGNIHNRFFRTLWVPTSSNWVTNTWKCPRVNLVAVLGKELQSFVDTNLPSHDNPYTPPILNFINKNFANAILDTASIKYVGVPLQDTANDDNFFVHYGENENPNIRQWYIDKLDKLSYLKRIDTGTKDLVIYENENSKPYISGLVKVSQLNDLSSLEEKYLFMKEILSHEFNFVKTEEQKNAPFWNIQNISESIAVKNTDTPYLSLIANSPYSDAALYTNLGVSNTEYSFDNGELKIFTKQKNALSLDGKLIKLDENDSSEIYSTPAAEGDFFLDRNGLLAPLARLGTDTPVDIGILTKPADLYVSKKENAIKNPYFEEGLWQQTVGDCNNYDKNGIVGMQLAEHFSPTAAGGKVGKYLQLSAARHVACTSQKEIPVTADQKYLFAFDYQSPNAKQAGYYLAFNDEEETVLNEKLHITSAEWQRFQKRITIPEGASKASLHVYSYSLEDGKTEIITNYDNFTLKPLEYVDTIEPQNEARFEKIPLTGGTQTKDGTTEYRFEYRDPKHDFGNRIPNAAFDEGLWKEQVGDCNNRDENGLIDMKLVKKATETPSSGDEKGNVLQLEATRHIACTGPGTVPVSSENTFLLEFDYQSDNAKQAGYYVGFNDFGKSSVSERIKITDTEWHTYSKQIKVPEGATTASLVVYAYETDKKTNNIVRYDNFHLIELPPLENRYYFVSDPGVELQKPQSVEFELINPTKKRVHIKGATTPFYLAMSESYHDQWQAQFNNAKINGFLQSWVPWVKPDAIAHEQHFELNGFLNGWYIDTGEHCQQKGLCKQNPDGSWDMELVIEFTPQRWFYLGLLISGTTLFGCLGYLAYDFRKSRKRRKTISQTT